MEVCVCVPAAHQRARGGRRSWAVRWFRQSGECVCVCVWCLGLFFISRFLILLILSPGSIIFWVKRRTIETASSSSRWALNWRMIKAGRLIWVISEMFVCDSGVCSDGGEVLAAGGASVSAGASQSLRDAWRRLHHHQQEAAAAAESDGAAAGGERQVRPLAQLHDRAQRVYAAPL